jgi:hypothetical protein
MVPTPAEVAAIVNVWFVPAFVTDHDTPVAVPTLTKSAAVKLTGFIGSENTNVKFMGTEFVFAA